MPARSPPLSRDYGERRLDQIDPLAELLAGDKRSWDNFVRRYAALIVAAVRGVASSSGDIEDLTQEVFVRLCKDQYRLLRSYDASRASLSTWITIVARSTARDALRRRRPASVPIDAVPEVHLKVDAVEPIPKLKLPEALLSPRQREILNMLYDQEMDVAEIATALGIVTQADGYYNYQKDGTAQGPGRPLHGIMLKITIRSMPRTPGKPLHHSR